MSKQILVVLMAVVAVAGLAQDASAQYMYMDSNGNGVRDAGDQMSQNGDSTVVDIWLNTNANRNGNAAVCNVDPASQLWINEYIIYLQAAGGTVDYRDFINRTPFPNANPGALGNPGDGVRFGAGFYSVYWYAPGLYRLGTLTITGLTGTPEINFVDHLSGASYLAGFGTQCPGNAFDNFYKLDGPETRAYQVTADWFDADGLPAAVVTAVRDFEGGGGAPILARAYPNPFNPETAIKYTVRSAGPVTVRIFSTDGRLVRTLKQDEMTVAGTDEVAWNGTDDQGRHVSSGIYFVRTSQKTGRGEESAIIKIAAAK